MESKPIEIRLLLTPEDELYSPFKELKDRTGIKNNTEIARMTIKLGIQHFKHLTEGHQ